MLILVLVNLGHQRRNSRLKSAGIGTDRLTFGFQAEPGLAQFLSQFVRHVNRLKGKQTFCWLGSFQWLGHRQKTKLVLPLAAGPWLRDHFLYQNSLESRIRDLQVQSNKMLVYTCIVFLVSALGLSHNSESQKFCSIYQIGRQSVNVPKPWLHSVRLKLRKMVQGLWFCLIFIISHHYNFLFRLNKCSLLFKLTYNESIY